MDQQYIYTNLIKLLLSILEDTDRLPTYIPTYGLCYIIMQYDCFPNEHRRDLIKFLFKKYHEYGYSLPPYECYWFPPINPFKGKTNITSEPISLRITFLKTILNEI